MNNGNETSGPDKFSAHEKGESNWSLTELGPARPVVAQKHVDFYFFHFLLLIFILLRFNHCLKLSSVFTVYMSLEILTKITQL